MTWTRLALRFDPTSDDDTILGGERRAIEQREFQCQEFLRVDLVPKVLSSYKRLRPGRPSTGDPKRRVSETVYSLKIRENSIRLRQERNLDGVFPLITNLRPKEHKALDVLQI